jgi:peptidoglycan hydrolase-like protein with peptidoglycan-binding domain
MRDVLKSVALGVILIAPQIATAEDAALIIVESDYRRLPDVPGAAQAATLAQALENAGFLVTSSLDQAAEDVWEAVDDFRADAARADRVFVLLSGHMVSTTRDSFLLTRHATRPTAMSVGAVGVPLGPILDLLAEHPGQAVLMLAPSGEDIAGDGLTPGAAPVAPQGVTLVSGPVDGLVRVANEVLLVPGAAPATGLSRPPRGVTVSGFVSDALPFLPVSGGAPVVVQPPAPPPPVADAEAAFWQVVTGMDTVDAYQTYLDRYPRGRFAALARDQIAAIEGDAEAEVRAAEEALGLSRDGRRQVQRNLSLLGYDPRGIDGIFGPGSRAAISAWQRARGYPVTGFLTRDQVNALNTAAAAQLEAEAEARRVERERLDRGYWRDTGRNGTEAGLRAYLQRYPDGLFSDVARAQLAEIEEAARAASAAEEGAFWDQVRAEDTAAAYRRYLDRYPRGAFVEAARAALAAIEDEAARADEIAAARDEERGVAGNPVTALLVETRLATLGFDVGRVDGSFDERARKAIRQYQRSRDLPVTGYVTRDTMVRLLAGN